MPNFKTFQKSLLSLDNDILKIENLFSEFTQNLMNNYSLNIDNKLYEFTELEYYYSNDNHHKDPYVHTDEKQKNEKSLYVHRMPWGRGGIDLTFGDGRFFGGILIRGIKDTEGFVSGPVKCKQSIVDSIEENIAKKHNELQEYFEKGTWSLVEKDKTDHDVFHSTRVGLTAKDDNYQDAFYRFIREDYLNNSKFTEKTRVKAICHFTMGYQTGVKSAINKIKNSKLMDKINLNSK